MLTCILFYRDVIKKNNSNCKNNENIKYSESISSQTFSFVYNKTARIKTFVSEAK